MRSILDSKWTRVLLIFVVVPLSACSLSPTKGDRASSSSSDGSGNSSTGTATAFSPSSDARKDVRDALAKLNSAYPYRMTEKIEASGNGETTPGGTRVVEFAAADRSHMKWTGGQGEDVEAISIGDKHYWFSGGKWTAGTVPSSGGVARGGEFAKKLAEMVKEVKYVGPETVNGMSCFAYTGTFETNMAGQQWTGTAKVWIGANDGLIHQSDSEYKVANYSNKSHIVYEYNVNIKVEAPI